MGKFWSLSNTEKQKGTLADTREFLGITDKSKISCCQVIVPITMDVKQAIFAASGIIGRPEKNQWNNILRSFEVWWDSEKMELKIVLASQSSDDLENFQTAFRTMYPNASFINMDRIVPVWYSPTKETENQYQIFDVSLYHGHYACRLDQPQNNITITQILNTIQLAKSAWIQFVFAPYNFTPYLRSHTNQLNKRIKYVKSKNYLSFIEELKEQKPHENPETGFDFYNHYKVLEKDSAEKMQNSHVVMSVRGLIDNDINHDDGNNYNNHNQGLTSLKPLDDVKCDYDHLTTFSYDYSKFFNKKKSKVAGSPIKIAGTKKNFQRISMFELRLIPSPRKPLENAINRYFTPNMITGNYGFRKTLPFLILNPDEIANLIQLPDPVNTRNIKITRNISLPSRQANKTGFNIGYFEESKNLDDGYGNQVKVVKKQAAVISTIDFSRHIYAVGGTGSGKTSLIREIAKHLEESNRNRTFPNSFIYLDPKGDDSLKFIQQCNPESIKNGAVHFLDPIKTNFSINPLELPKYSQDQREETVSRYVGYFMEIVREWYGQQQTFVQMERIFRVLLFYMYLKNDAPTFLDMYDIIINLQEEQEKFLQVMFKALGMPGDDLKQALTSIAGLRPESFNPLLNRVEQFATDPILKKVFCVRHGTVKFEDLIKPNNITIVRISPLDLAHHVQPLAIQAFIIKLWFTIQERAARIYDEDKRNPVILALDEFQIVSKLQVLPMILSQARSYKLGLLLAHQTTAQIDDTLLEEITGNCGTQLAGRISGKDASKLSKIWDPRFSGEITQQLAAQEDFHWTIKMRASAGEEQSTPVQFWLHKPPKLSLNDGDLEKFIENQRNLYGHGKVEEFENDPLLQKYELQKNHWLRYITVDLPETKQHWQILLMLYNENNEPLQLTQITEKLEAKTRDNVVSILKKMVKDGLLEADESTRNVKYSLSKKAIKNYFTFDPKDIGSADDIPQLTKHVIKSYLDMGLFVTVALQRIEKDEDRTDLIAYSYDSDKSISVEIESTSELLSHPEHAIYNMRKWKKWDLTCVIHGHQVRNYKRSTINKLLQKKQKRLECL
ncbi:TraM recognition domain-containing protein [Nitrosopumilus sp.]|uniref:TraM recognition domain-containing protein n=1 Tax=Nitrosopumilus sp. TaxID=2024843 RepID=UPI00292D16DD|nr:TraM recognition domain-containing protein [Nitrosopumilus sp.]